jgi:energy-coupling factor transporter ATP-binding protein EcfA2
VKRIEVDTYAAELSFALGGIKRGAVILLSGNKGAGKSTLAAELAYAIRARRRRGHVWWLDRDQADSSLVLELVLRVGHDPRGMRLIAPPRSIGWAEALKQVPPADPVYVCDSLQAWGGPNFNAQDAVMDHVLHDPTRSKYGRVAIVIARNNAQGVAAGHVSAQYDADAVINVTPKALEIEKCRWLPGCPLTVPRVERGLPEGVTLH